MDIAYLSHVLTQAGLLRDALPDAMARASSRFADQEPSLEALDHWAQELRQQAGHLFGRRSAEAPDDDDLASTPAEALGWPEEVYAKASAETKLAAWRELQAELGEDPTQGREQRRPKPIRLTEAQTAHLQALPPTQRLTESRLLQSQQG